MKEFMNDMKILYDTRHIRKINPFIKKWLSLECCIMGTSLTELCCTRKEIRELFDSDLRYWYNLKIDHDNYAEEVYGEYTFCTCHGTLSYIINENKKRYEGYGQFCRDLASDPLSGSYVNASRIAYVLDTLLSSRKSSRRENRIGVTIYSIFKAEKAQFIAFAVDHTIDTTDCYYNGSKSIMDHLAVEKTLFSQDKDGLLDEHLAKSGYSEWSYTLKENGIFYGVGLLPRNETRDQVMIRVLDQYKDADDYQPLYDLRVMISRMQLTYAIEDNPKAIVRFFGIKAEKGVSFLVPFFPNIFYLEKK